MVPYSDVMCTPGTRPSGGVCSGGIICKSFGIQRRNYYRLIVAPVCRHAYTHPNATLHFQRVNKAASSKGWKWRAGGIGKNKLFPVWPAINPAAVVIIRLASRGLSMTTAAADRIRQHTKTVYCRGRVFSRGIYITHIGIKIYTCMHTAGCCRDLRRRRIQHGPSGVRDWCRGGRCGPA